MKKLTTRDKARKKLQLKRDIVRALSNPELARVKGGNYLEDAVTPCSCTNPIYSA